MILLLEDKGIESIPLKSGKGLGLRSEYSSRFLCFTRVDSFAKKNPKSADSSTCVRERYVLDTYKILDVYIIR
jgi:hypothetical protein